MARQVYVFEAQSLDAPGVARVLAIPDDHTLDELQKEARTDSLSTRFDLRPVREQSARWVDMAKK